MTDKQLEALAEEVWRRRYIDWANDNYKPDEPYSGNEFQIAPFAVEALKEMYNAGAKEGWISVDERMPEDRSYVLVSNGDDIELVLYKHGLWMYDDRTVYSKSWEFTHWRELPPSPNKTT